MCCTHVSGSFSSEVIEFGGLNARIHAHDDLLGHQSRIDFRRQCGLLFAQATNSQSDFIKCNLDALNMYATSVSEAADLRITVAFPGKLTYGLFDTIAFNDIHLANNTYESNIEIFRSKIGG